MYKLTLTELRRDTASELLIAGIQRTMKAITVTPDALPETSPDDRAKA